MQLCVPFTERMGLVISEHWKASLICILSTVIANCCNMIQSAKNNLLITLCSAQVLSPVTKQSEIMRGGARDKFGNWRPEEWMS